MRHFTNYGDLSENFIRVIKESTMKVSPYAGILADPTMLIDVSKLITAYYTSVRSYDPRNVWFTIFGYVTATLATFFVGRDAENTKAGRAGTKGVVPRKGLIALREESLPHTHVTGYSVRSPLPIR
jgi:hypothetical protein